MDTVKLYRSFVITMFLLAALLLTCSRTITLTDDDNGKEISLEKGASLNVRLKAKLSTGYSWKVASYNKDVISTSESVVQTQKEDVVGGVDFQLFTLEAKEQGQGEIVFHYVQPWKKDASPLKTYSVTVTVE